MEIGQHKTRLVIPTRLRDDDLSFGNLGEIQRALRAENAKEDVCIDLSNCEWVDPLPVMMLLAELAIWRSVNTAASLVLNIGTYGTADSSKRQARLRKFLLNHGFLDAFSKHADAVIEYDKDATGMPESFRLRDPAQAKALAAAVLSHGVVLSYESAELVPVDLMLFNVSHPVDSGVVGRFIDIQVRAADRHFFYQRPSARSSRDTTLQRMRHVFLELVRNAWEHAYRKQPANRPYGAVTVFARLRRPQHNEDALCIGDEKDPMAQAERTHCPQIQLVQDRGLGLQVEVFVCDVGGGLTADLAEWLSASRSNEDSATKSYLTSLQKSTEYTKFPLRCLDRLLFSYPVSRFDRASEPIAKERGALTGLQYLGHVLGYHNDVTRIAVGHEWASRSHHTNHPPDIPKYEAFDEQRKISSERISGTFIQVALVVQQTPDLAVNGWADIIESQWDNYRNQLIAKLAKPIVPFDFYHSLNIVDLRAESGNVENVSTVGIGKCRAIFDSSESPPLVRTRRNFEKNLIYPMLDAWIESTSPKAVGIVFCDMSRFQGLIVDHAVRGFTRTYGNNNPPPQLATRKYILLLTEDLASKLYQVVIRHVNEKAVLTIRHSSLRLDATTSLRDRHVHVLSQLRLLDSKAFWNRVDVLKQDKRQPILIGPVAWTPSTTLPEYLNFSLAAHDAVIASILRRSLRRLVALFPDCKSESLDELIDAELHDANKWLLHQSFDSQIVPRLLVGSVLVSGVTVEGHRQTYEFEIKGILHVLVAPMLGKIQKNNFDIPSLVALLWKKQTAPSGPTEIKYIRIPDSPYVSKADDRLFPIGRIHHRDDVVGTTPAEMYRAFFRDRLIKVGHWSYGGRHSLLDINAVAVLDASADTDNGFFIWLGNQIESIAPTGVVVIGYPVQRLASMIARTLEKKLPHHIDRQRIKWLPLHYMPSTDGALTRLSPLTSDQLKDYIDGVESQSHFCFVDVGVVSSRTFRHTRRQVRAHGVHDISGFVLQNRTSWPTLTEELRPEIGKFEGPSAFWRWGVPVFPGASSCPICNGLAGLPHFRDLILKHLKDVASILDKVEAHWTSQDLADAWFEHGLEPESLEAPVTKKMGYWLKKPGEDSVNLQRYELAKDDKNRPVFWHLVEHECSTTLASHAIEVAASTHRFAYPLSVAMKTDKRSGRMSLEPTVSLEVLTCSLLLLGKDMTLRQKHDYLEAILKTILTINHKGRAVQGNARLERLMGLTLIVLMVQPPAAKRAVSERLLEGLATQEIVDPWVRAPLISITRDTSVGSRVYRFFQDQLRIRLETERPGPQIDHGLSLLRKNAIRMGLQKISHREAWLRLNQIFGRGPAHEGSAMQAVILAKAKECEFGTAANKRFATIATHRAYLPLFVSAIDVLSVLSSIGVLNLFKESDLAELEKNFTIWARPNPDIELGINPIDEYQILVTRARTLLWQHLIRFEQKDVISIKLLMNCFRFPLNWSNVRETFGVSDSIPWCQQLTGLVDEIVENAEREGEEMNDPWGNDNGSPRKHWVHASTLKLYDKKLGFSLEIQNSYLKKDNLPTQKAKLPVDFLYSIGGTCESNFIPSTSAENTDIYSVKLFIPYLSAIEFSGDENE